MSNTNGIGSGLWVITFMAMWLFLYIADNIDKGNARKREAQKFCTDNTVINHDYDGCLKVYFQFFD